VHGELDQFAGRGVAIAWAILKAPVEDQSQVVVRVAALEPRLAAVRIVGIDPFTQQQREVLPLTPLGAGLQSAAARGSFADFPHRQFQFYTANGEHVLTVYFMGVPDTSPEFLAEPALAAHLDQTLAKLKAAGGSRP
jgi:hypothetical protein